VNIQEVIDKAEPGPLVAGELASINGLGKVRVTYNWLYSGLNCDPNDESSFVWTLNKQPSGKTSLSTQFESKTLYASMRPDNSYYVGVQAPNSADWITAVGDDEEMHMVPEETSLPVFEFEGVGVNWLAVENSLSSGEVYPGSGQTHSGHQLRGDNGAEPKAKKFFLTGRQSFQSQAPFPLIDSLAPAEVSAELTRLGVTDPDGLTQQIFSS